MLLADAAQEVNGKLSILGRGWSQPAGPAPTAIAIKIDVPWTEANHPHPFWLTLSDEDGQAVRIGPILGGEPEMVSEEGQPVEVQGQFVVGRPPDAVAGADLPNRWLSASARFPCGRGRTTGGLDRRGE